MTETNHAGYDRITFSLPKEMHKALNRHKQEIHRSKTDIINMAIADYLAKQEKEKLRKAVAVMTEEYAQNEALTEFTVFDSEAFL